MGGLSIVFGEFLKKMGNLCENVFFEGFFEVCGTSELPAKGTFLRSFCVVQKEPKSTPEVCEPLDSGDDSKHCRELFCKNFR